MGAVKRTHRQSREIQQLRKLYRKHPEHILISKCARDVMESLTPVINILVECITKIAKEIIQAIDEKYREGLNHEDISAFRCLEDRIKNIEEEEGV